MALSLVAAVIHVGVMPKHFEEHRLCGAFLLILGLLQLA